MNEIDISIIIPCLNEERYVGRCLDAIAALELRPHEVLVVDNGSTDKTAEVAGRYDFVRVLREPRRGRAFAQIAGFNAATGTVLARLDADAVVSPDWTARIADYYSRPEALQTAWTGGASFYNVRFPRLVSAVYDWLAFRFNQLLTGHPTLWGSSMALPRALWAQVAGQVCQRSDLHEDLDLSIHLHRHGCPIVYDDHTKVQVELRPAYASTSKLWAYLELWPRTLRIHGIRTWWVCWIANFFMFTGMPFFGISERAARLFGRPPLSR